MGALIYPVNRASPIEMDDRTLAHLQIIIGSKLRSGQGFFFSWTEDVANGSGRTSVWIYPSLELRFVYATAQRHVLNRGWLESLMNSANSAEGLSLTSEPRTVALAA